MTVVQSSEQVGVFGRVHEFFKARDVFFHDGTAMRRVHLTARAQIMAAAGAIFVVSSSAAGLASVVISAPSVASTLTTYAARQAEVSRMETQVAALQSEVATIRRDAVAHADRLDKRQAFLASLLEGKGDAPALSAMIPTNAARPDAVSSDVLAAFAPVEMKQASIAGKLRATVDARYAVATKTVAGLGIDPRRMNLAMGGPYEPVTAVTVTSAQPVPVTSGQADPQFRALFNSWKRLDQIQQAIVSIPSVKPVLNVTINSGYGVRSDPFRGTAAMHAGVDIPGAYATPIYATADGVVGRAGRAGGYGNLVELNHGRGIQTRYGHLASILVAAGTKVKRGQLIGLMGSTGRSTGNHLHYEVRLDGHAVNPMPFLQSTDYLIAMQRRTQVGAVAMGGPVKGE